MSAHFSWEDPLLLEAQLTGEERAVTDAARDYARGRLALRIQMAFRTEEADPVLRGDGPGRLATCLAAIASATSSASRATC